MSSWLSKKAALSWGAYLSIIALTYIVYLPSLNANFMIDDGSLLFGPHMYSAEGLARIWTTKENIDYWPLTYTSFWVQRQLFDQNPLPYHLINTLIHALNACLLIVILRKLAVPGAWLAGAIFALHPVAVESVAWVSELKNTQSCFFFLLAVLFFIRFLDLSKKRWYWLSVLFFICALLSKSSTAVLPGVLLLISWWKKKKLRLEDWALQTPFVALAICDAFIATWFQETQASGSIGVWSASWPARIALAGHAIWFYLGKSLFPIGLSFNYPLWDLESSSWSNSIPAGLVVMVLVLLYLYRDRWTHGGFFSFAYFLGALTPALGFFNLYGFWFSHVADRWQYLALFGPVAWLASTLVFLLEKKFQKALIPGASALILTLGILTWQRAAVFSDEEKLWKDTLSKAPNSSFALGGMGFVEYKKGNYDAAVDYYRKSLAVYPEFFSTQNNLALCLRRQGKLPDAETEWLSILQKDPGFASAHKNLGDLYFDLQNYEQAVFHYQGALDRFPHWTEAQNRLGITLAKMGMLEDARKELEDALLLAPNSAEIRNNLGTVFLNMGKLQEALREYRKAILLVPDYFEAAYGISFILGEQSYFEEGIQSAKFAIEMAKKRGLAEQIPNLEKMIEDYQQKKPFRPKQ